MAIMPEMTKNINNMETIVIKKVETTCLCTILTENSAALKEGSQEEFCAFSIISRKLISEAKKVLTVSFGEKKKWAVVEITATKLIDLSYDFENGKVDRSSCQVYCDEDICLSLVFGNKSVSLVATILKTTIE